MAKLDGARERSEGRDTLAETLQKIGEQAAREAREDKEEIQRLRLRLAESENIQQENERLRNELERAQREVEESKKKKSVKRTIPPSDIDSSEELSPESQRKESTHQHVREEADTEHTARRSLFDLFAEELVPENRDFGVQTETDLDDEFPNIAVPALSYERLASKYNELMIKYKQSRDEYNALHASSKNLQKNHTSVREARNVLELKVRELRDHNMEWHTFAGKLNEKNNELKAAMVACPHGHRDVLLKSRSPEHKVSERTRNATLAGNYEGDGKSPYPPSRSFGSASPNNLSKIVTPVSASFEQRLERLRSSPQILGSASTKLSSVSRTTPHRRKDILTTEARSLFPSSLDRAGEADAPIMTDQAMESRSARHDEVFPDEVMPPFDELDLELPRLADGNASSKTQELHHTSSTQGDPYPTQHSEPKCDSPVLIKSEGDSPVFLSARPVKKSKSRGMNAGNVAFKTEDTISTPISLDSPPALEHGESMDLDDHPHMPTPRKRRNSLRSRRAHPPDDELLDEDDGIPAKVQASTAILVERSPERPLRNFNALQTLSSNKQVLQRTADGQPPLKRRRRDGHQGLNHSPLKNDENSGEPFKHIRGLRNTKSRRLVAESCEATKNRNIATNSGSTPYSGKTSQRRNLTPGITPRLSPPSSMECSLAASRLSSLEGGPRFASSGDIFEPPSSSPNERQLFVSSTETAKSSKNKPPERQMDAPADDQHNEPLRARPLERLKLDDFKVNPKYNHGYSHAFLDVVRKKDERRCLPGCEKDCCGPKFRKLAAMTISARIQPISESIREGDRKLISEYLGDEYPKYSKFSDEKKTETLIRAMARQFAKSHGKHRHAYGRSGSPPGYWDTGFPDTQEMQANRRAAYKAERQKVEERFREAMRPGGAYSFRDE